LICKEVGMKVLLGKPVADAIYKKAKNRIDLLKEYGYTPRVAMVQIGAAPDDTYYKQSLIRQCQAIGIQADDISLPQSTTEEDLIHQIQSFNENPEIHGVMIFRPLPRQISNERISAFLDHCKDVDYMNPDNLGKIILGKSRGRLPGTPAAVMEMLDFYGIPLEGKEVVIVNRSLVVGKPLAMLMLDRSATVTVCHSKTRNLSDKMKQADIVVSAVGKAELFGAESFDSHSIVIDVGINKRPDGSICGDVRFDEVETIAAGISPVPRGIGTVTSAVLLRNVVYSCRQLSGLSMVPSFEERWG